MAKKSFKDNPALRFISPPPAAPAPASRPSREAAPEAPVKPDPRYVETKSRRVQLLMQPSLHEHLKNLAAARGRSLNDLIHAVLTDWAEKEI